MTLSDFITILNEDYFSAAGVLSSIAGFLLSVFVLLAVRKIKKFYIFTARVPLVNEKLVDIASSISDHLNSFDGYTTKTFKILADAEINLKSLSRKVDGPLRKQVENLVKEISSINASRHPVIQSIIDLLTFSTSENGETEKELLERIYVSLYKITKECSTRYEDARWER